MTITSSPDPIERAFEPGDVKEGYFEVKDDVKCLTNVRAARMFPFWRYLNIRRLSVVQNLQEDEPGTYGSIP